MDSFLNFMIMQIRKYQNVKVLYLGSNEKKNSGKELSKEVKNK